MKELTTGIGLMFAGIAVLIVIGIFFAWPVQLLWNECLINAVDGVHPITFWQALGLNFLFSILFKGHSTTSKK